MKKLFYFTIISIFLISTNAHANERIFASPLAEYLITPDDIVIYSEKDKNSQIQSTLPEQWEDIIGNLEKAKDGSTWYSLTFINDDTAIELYPNHGGYYIPNENVELLPNKALSDFYEGKYIASYYFEGTKRIVLFSEIEEGENGKTLHAYGFDILEDVESFESLENYDALDESKLKPAFHQENYIENCSNTLIREYLYKTFMEDSNENGIQEIWYAFPNSCENPYEPKRFDVIMQENEDNFHAMKLRKSAGPAFEESAFEVIESNIQNEKSYEVAESVLTWLVSNVMTEEMYVEKRKKELVGKWIIKSQMIDNEYFFPKKDQVHIEFLTDGTMLFYNPQNKEFPRGEYAYSWYFADSDARGIFIKIVNVPYSFDFSEKEGSIFVSNKSSYFMFEKISKEDLPSPTKEIDNTNANEALFTASERGDVLAVKNALKNNADINSYTEYLFESVYGPYTALHVATIHNRNDVVKILIEHKANLNIGAGSMERTALEHAILNENFEIIKMLLENGANPNTVNALGVSPFILATNIENADIIQILREYGADEKN